FGRKALVLEERGHDIRAEREGFEPEDEEDEVVRGHEKARAERSAEHEGEEFAVAIAVAFVAAHCEEDASGGAGKQKRAEEECEPVMHDHLAEGGVGGGFACALEREGEQDQGQQEAAEGNAAATDAA